jgi:hypothetical protein
MKTPAFDYCLKVLGKWDDHDSEIRDELMFETKNFPDEIIEQFRRELNKNLLNKNKTRIRKELVKYYIDEMNRTTKIIEKYLSLEMISYYDLDNQVILRFTGNPGMVIKFRIFEMVCVLYKKLFDEIQISCKTFDIPFIEICNEIKFPLNTIGIKGNSDKEKNNNSGSGRNRGKKPQIKPVFDNDYIDQVYNLLKGFFPEDQQEQFLALLKDGGLAPVPLVFKDNGNRLLDTFKKLYSADIIKGCSKLVLQAWIGQNFTFISQGKVKKYKSKYLALAVSSADGQVICKRPILDVILDKTTGRYLLVKK